MTIVQNKKEEPQRKEDMSNKLKEMHKEMMKLEVENRKLKEDMDLLLATYKTLEAVQTDHDNLLSDVRARGISRMTELEDQVETLTKKLQEKQTE